MDKVIVQVYLLVRNREAMRRVKWRKSQAKKRRTAFALRQAQERLIFSSVVGNVFRHRARVGYKKLVV